MTTVSAPAGSQPPVAIATASPAPTARGNTSPIGTEPATDRTTGHSADAPRTSAPRTA